MNYPMNIADFTSNKEVMEIAEASVALSVETDTFDDAEAVVVYPGDIFITRHADVDHMLNLSRPFEKDIRTGHCEYLEPILYFNHYVSQCVQPQAWTKESLSVLLEEYCDWERLTVGDQTHTRENLSPDQRVWLQWHNATLETLH